MAAILRQEKSLGQILVNMGLLRRDQLDAALEEQKRSGDLLGRVLVKAGWVTERDVINALKGLLVVTFKLGEEDFGAEAHYVREIIRHVAPVPLPQAPSYVEGIINLRDRVVPILDLRKRFGLASSVEDRECRIIVCELPRRLAGLKVDSVGAVLQLQMDALMESPGASGGIPGKFLYGLGRLGEKIFTLLNLENLLESQQEIHLRPLNEANPGSGFPHPPTAGAS